MKRTATWLAAPTLMLCGVLLLAHWSENAERGGGSFNPCLEPLRWRVGRVDARFEVSRDEIREMVEAAAAVWESPTGRHFFQYDSVDGWPIELVYDHRQAAADEDRRRRRRIQTLEAEIERLERTHERHRREYRRARASYDRRTAAVGQRIASHNATVERWNERGGAPASVLRRLREDAAAIDRDRAEVDRLADALEDRRRRLETRAEQLRRAIDEYNALVRAYGRTPSRRIESGSFEETVVTRGGRRTHTDRRLTVFQFDDRDEFARVLAHELGHALGLSHVADPAAIMHEEYDSEDVGHPLRPHDADFVALIERCGTDVWKATR